MIKQQYMQGVNLIFLHRDVVVQTTTNPVMMDDGNKQNGTKDPKNYITDKISFQNEKFSLSDAGHHQDDFIHDYPFL